MPAKKKCSICGKGATTYWWTSNSGNKNLCEPCRKRVFARGKKLGVLNDTPYLQVLKEHHKVKPAPVGDRRERRDMEGKCLECECDLCSECDECHGCEYIEVCSSCSKHANEDEFYYCENCGDSHCECMSHCPHCDCCENCCSTCDDCGECNSNCSCYGEGDIAVDLWDLPLDLDLPGVAATFYLRADMAAEDDMYRDRFVAFAEEIAPIFARYLDMAIGGELRYGVDECEGARGLMPDILAKYDNGRGQRLERGRAWAEWKELRAEIGAKALVQAEDCLLNGSWHGGMGGKKWGSAAHLLLLYETGQIDHITFVDSAFGLEHNNGCIFNKRWTGGSKLRQVLDANLKRDQGPEARDEVLLKRSGAQSRIVKAVLPDGSFTTHKDYKMPSETLRVSDIYWGLEILLIRAPEKERRRYEAWRRYSHRSIR